MRKHPAAPRKMLATALAVSLLLTQSGAAWAFSLPDFVRGLGSPGTSPAALSAPKNLPSSPQGGLGNAQSADSNAPLSPGNTGVRTGFTYIDPSNEDIVLNRQGAIEIGQYPMRGLPPDAAGLEQCKEFFAVLDEYAKAKLQDRIPTSTPMDTSTTDADGNAVDTPFGAALTQAQTVLSMQKGMKPLFESAAYEALGGIFNSGFTLENLGKMLSSAISGFLTGNWGALISQLFSKALDWGFRYIIDQIYNKAIEEMRGNIVSAINQASSRMFGAANQQTAQAMQGLASRYGINAGAIANRVMQAPQTSFSRMLEDPSSGAYARRSGKCKDGYCSDPNSYNNPARGANWDKKAAPNPAQKSGGDLTYDSLLGWINSNPKAPPSEIKRYLERHLDSQGSYYTPETAPGGETGAGFGKVPGMKKISPESGKAAPVQASPALQTAPEPAQDSNFYSR